MQQSLSHLSIVLTKQLPSYQVIHISHPQIIQFYAYPLSHLVLHPISKIPKHNSLQILISIPKDTFLTSLYKQSNIDQIQLSRQVIRLCKLGPSFKINLQNIYLCGNCVRVLITEPIESESLYLSNLKQILNLLLKKKEHLMDSLVNAQSVRQLEILGENLRGMQDQFYSISNLSRYTIKCTHTAIRMGEADKDWILQAISQPSKKLQLIASLSSFNYEPQRLHACILNKQPLLYILQTKTHLLAFYTPIKYKESKEMFGKYLNDTKLLSKLMSITHKTVHSLLEGKKSVGYGKQCLMVIGEMDLVVSCANVENYCEFPKSYQPSQAVKTPQQLVGGKTFTLDEMEVYAIV